MKKFLATLFCLCLVSLSHPGFADVEKTETTPASAPVMDPAEMQKMMEMNAPGPMHKMIETLVGKWDYTTEMRMMPNAPMETSKGTNENTMIYGGRFLKQKSKSTMKMGDQVMEFEGMGVLGYDNITKQFVSTWMDNMTTGVMTSKGTYDEATKTITQTGEMSCPMYGKTVMTRTETKFIDADSYSFAMYMMDEKTATEFKSMEIMFKRVK